MTNKEEITYPIKIEKELWDKFKNKIPRSITLNEAIINLIKKEVEENGEKK